MSGNDINRRDFLKYMGLGGVSAAALSGCDMPTTVTLEEGKETVVSYLAPEEYVIPGIGVWYASTCQQCPSACGVHGRVREGRLLKVEGNPDSPINGVGLCQMGQASVQTHYNPDRITQPMVRQGGDLVPVSWDEVWKLMQEKASNVAPGRSAWFTGTVSGHQSVLLAELKTAWGGDHFTYEAINNAVGEAVNKEVLGDAMPSYHIAKAKTVLSFGADFLGTWLSPVHFSQEYAEFRSGDRGVLIQVEPKMSMTGMNADLWVAARPGTEGVLALGIANVLLTKHQLDGASLSVAQRDVIAQYSAEKVTEITGVAGETVSRIAAYLKERSPSVVLSGASAHGHVNGYQNAMAIMMLNVLLGNIGKTIEASNSVMFDELRARTGSSRALLDFTKAVGDGQYDVVFFQGANPVYSAPNHLALSEKLSKVPFKVVFSMFMDETTMVADVVLPLSSSYEEWATHVAPYQPKGGAISMSQPVMKQLYPETRAFGDLLLGMLKHRGVEGYADFDDYYAYLRGVLKSLPASLKDGKSDDVFWADTLQRGFIKASASGSALTAVVGDITQVSQKPATDYPMHLVPSIHQNMWDGRNANLPWLQEAPDQVSKVFWDSWAELHPKTADKLGVKEGDFIRVESAQGAVEVQVYIFKGVHPDVVAIPMGQGHEAYGRYAKGVGVNVLKMLSPAIEEKSGEIAAYATQVRISKTGKHAKLARLGGSEYQMGRKLVATVAADVFRRTEGGSDVA